MQAYKKANYSDKLWLSASFFDNFSADEEIGVACLSLQLVESVFSGDDARFSFAAETAVLIGRLEG